MRAGQGWVGSDGEQAGVIVELSPPRGLPARASRCKKVTKVQPSKETAGKPPDGGPGAAG